MTKLRLLTQNLLDDLKKLTAGADTIYWMTAFLVEKLYQRDTDLADKQGLALHKYDEAKVAKLIETMPMTKWSDTSKGLIQFEAGIFTPQIKVIKEHEEILFEWIKEICEYRLHCHFKR